MLLCLLEFGIWTPALQCGLLSWGYELPRFGMAPRVGLMDSHALVLPLEFWMWTPTLLCGLRVVDTVGYGLPRFGVAPRLGVMNSHSLVWPLEFWIRTPMLRCGPSSWGYGQPCTHCERNF